MKKILIFVLIVLSYSCDKQNDYSLETSKYESLMPGLAKPITLNYDTTTIHINDFFVDTKPIDSIVFPQGIKILTVDSNLTYTVLTDKQKLKQLSVINIYTNNVKFSVPLIKSPKIKYDFVFNPNGKNYKTVQIVGEVNSWNPRQGNMTYSDGKWHISLYLPEGKYQYLLVLDGKWQTDPNNPIKVDNGQGGFNSLLETSNPTKQKISVRTYDYTDNYVRIKCNSKNYNVLAFWQNYLLDDKFIEKKDSFIKIYIPKNATDTLRSYIRLWAYDDKNISNDILIPLHNGKVLDTTSNLLRTDYEAAVIYNVFVDRFYNGNTSNDRPLDRPDVLPKADYYGGDIAGIEKILKKAYFDSLGVNTLWISPIVKNPEGAYGQYHNPETKFSAYHGYWPISFTQIDDRMGTETEFLSLIKSAHSKNMNILLDFVANHVHEQHPVYKQHKDWATNLYLPDGSLNTERWDEYRLTTWFDVFLPTLNLEKPEVYNMLSDSAVYWIKKYNLDGFRHDATKHIPDVFWRTLTLKLKKQIVIPEHRRILQIGETYGTPELISSYIGSGMLDAQFDFNVYDAALAAFARKDGNFGKLTEQINKSFDYYGVHNLMGNITGNQDRARFISYADGSISFGEDAKQAGWHRNIQVKDTIGYYKAKQLMAFIMTMTGIPVIFYGDEIGMPGGNDPDCRRMMKFDNIGKYSLNLRNTTAKLIKLRRNNTALIYGDFIFLLKKDKQLVYARTYFDKIVIVAFNIDNKPVNIDFEIPAQFDNENLKSKFSARNIKGKHIKLTLDANSFDIFTN